MPEARGVLPGGLDLSKRGGDSRHGPRYVRILEEGYRGDFVVNELISFLGKLILLHGAGRRHSEKEDSELLHGHVGGIGGSGV